MIIARSGIHNILYTLDRAPLNSRAITVGDFAGLVQRPDLCRIGSETVGVTWRSLARIWRERSGRFG